MLIINLVQILALAMAGFAVLTFGAIVVPAQVWSRSAKRRARNAGKGGWKHYHQHFSPRYDRIFVPLSKLLLPLIWVAGAGVTVWAVVRIILSFIA